MISPLTRLASLASLVSLALAYSETSPLVMWSSTTHLPETPSLSAEHLCSHDAIIVVTQPGLHASDLRTLPASSHLSRSLESALSSRQFPYVPHSSSSEINCAGSNVVELELGGSTPSFVSGGKYTITIEMPGLSMDIGPERKGDMREYESLLGATLASEIIPHFPNHIVIYTGSSLFPGLSKRQAPPSSPVTAALSAPSTIKGKKGGILHRYQLLTPGIIISLLIVLFVFLPILSFAIRALASVQSPSMKEAPKGFSARDKKNN